MLNGTKTVIKHKIGLLNLAEELGNVSKACRIMGLSRDTFYRYQNAVEQGGIDAFRLRKLGPCVPARTASLCQRAETLANRISRACYQRASYQPVTTFYTRVKCARCESNAPFLFALQPATPAT